MNMISWFIALLSNVITGAAEEIMYDTTDHTNTLNGKNNIFSTINCFVDLETVHLKL